MPELPVEDEGTQARVARILRDSVGVDAERIHPDARLVHTDIGRWEPPREYDLIVAWDSLWHVPLAD